MMSNTSLSPLRILVVENDPRQRADLVDTLRVWDYETYFAETPDGAEDAHQSLLEDARQKARAHRCHLAVVDMRLKDDNSLSDISGWTLIPSLAPTMSIILSGHLDNSLVSEIMDPRIVPPHRVCGCVSKGAGVDALREALHRAEKVFWSRRPMTIVRPKELEPDIFAQRYAPEGAVAPPDEVDDVLRRLFPEARRLKIELASVSQRASGVPLRGRSAVLMVTKDGNTLPEVVKIARSGRIKEEINRFYQVAGRFGTLCYAQPISNPVELWNVGGVSYRFVGGQNEDHAIPFSDYYAVSKPKSIKAAIVSFKRFWNLPSQDRPSEEDRYKTILAAYNHVWGMEWCERLLEYQSHPLLDQYPPTFAQLGLSNPISWLVKKINLSIDGKYDDGGLPDIEMAMTHGDLHGDNLFVDSRHEVWVIDYERTGFGPVLQDWVELENDILTRLAEMDTSSSWSGFLQLVSNLLSTKTVRPSKSTAIQVAGFAKEWKCICMLRELAATSSSTTDGRPYYWGLLFNALFRLTLLLKEQDTLVTGATQATEWDERLLAKQSHAIQRCLSFAGIICHRLESWNKKWPPREWSPYLSDTAIAEPYRQGFAPVPQPQLSETRNYALVIGVGETPNDPRSSLSTTVKDAEALKDVLVDPAICTFSPRNVHVLCNATASLQMIRDELIWLADQTTANPNSTAIVYFSGHGGSLQGSNEYFLVPSTFDPSNLEGTVLWASEFTQRLRDIRAKRVLVLIDACQAAAMASAKDASLLQNIGFIEMPPPNDLLKSWQQNQSIATLKSPTSAPSRGEGRAVVSSSRGDQSSYIRKDATFSIFTHHLLEALRGDANRPGDALVTVSTLIGHLSRNVPVSAQRDWNKPQVPWADFAGEDFQIATIIGGVVDDVSISPKHSVAPGQPVRLFYSYSHRDWQLRDRLEKHLSLLKREGVIVDWHDRRISAGREWEGTINDNLRLAEVILLLISADFLASDYCYDVEMKIALELHAAGKARVIPVILRAVEWQEAPFGRLLALPTDGKPVAEWRSKDRAFQDVARGIRMAVDELRASQP